MPQRLAKPTPAEMSDETAALLTLVAGDDPPPPATIELLAHDPALLGPFLTWAAALALRGTLPKREHELLALSAAHHYSSPFEWDEHRTFAIEAGLSDADVEAVAAGPDSPHWNVDDALLLSAAADLLTTGAVNDETYAALGARWSTDQLVEIPMIVGQYAMLSMLTGFFDVPAR